MSSVDPAASNDRPVTPPPSSARPASDSPISAKISGKVPFMTDQFERSGRFNDFAKEMTDKFVGPVDPKEFLDTYLGMEAFADKSVPASPWNDALKEKFRLVHNLRVVNGKLLANRETVMYTPLANAINDCIDTESFEYARTETSQDCRQIRKTPVTMPDGILYHRTRSKRRVRKSDAAFSDSVTEVKGPKHSKPFDDTLSDGGHFERRTEEAVKIRGQITAYAVAQFVHQFRTHLFMVLVHINKARLVRWDHAGAIVTAEFAYSEEDYLADFYSRYSRATPEARGIDTTVRRLESDDAMAGEVRAQLKLADDEPVFEFQVWNDSEGGREREGGKEVEDGKEEGKEAEDGKKLGPLPYYGTLPLVSNDQSVTGRATRIFKVWDPRDKVVVLLKDAWRVDSSSIEREGRVYAILDACKVKNVPKCLRSGDVNPGASNHRTRTHDCALARPGGRAHVHYRLILREVCRGNVTEFKDTRELVTVIRDSLIAHQDAYQKAELLHRDVSAGNILITEDGTGLLVDWELAKSTSELEKARQPERTGTWQFISAALLSDKPTYSKLEDDRESHFHVLGWTALQYTKHSTEAAFVADHLRDGYDKTVPVNGKVHGGTVKLEKMKSSALAKIGFVPGPLADLIIDLEETCAARYADDPNPKPVEIARKALLNEALDPEERAYHLNNPDYRVQERRNRLSSDTWFIDRFNEALESDKWTDEALERCQIKFPKKDPLPVTSKRTIEEDPGSERAAKRQRTSQTVASSQPPELGTVIEDAEMVVDE